MPKIMFNIQVMFILFRKTILDVRLVKESTLIFSEIELFIEIGFHLLRIDFDFGQTKSQQQKKNAA